MSSGDFFAEVPCKINYQGRLIENNVPVDGTKTMKFSIYNSAVGGTLRWTSEDVSVEVHNGLFRYVLGEGFIEGSSVADLSSIDWTAGEELYLEVQVGTDILTPREAIYAYPYAINSHLLEGATKEYFLNTSAEAQTKRGNLEIEGMLDINAPDTDIDALRVHSGDTYGLYVSTGGNVGIGTTSPRGDLDIAGIDPTLRLTNLDVGNWDFVIEPRGEILNLSSAAGTQIMAFKQNGNVGIGTTGPNQLVELASAITGIQGAYSNHPVLRLTQAADPATNYQRGDVHSAIEFYTEDTGNLWPGVQAAIKIQTTRAEGQSLPDAGIAFWTANSDAVLTQRMIIAHNGYVGIGRTNPQYSLHVKGTVRATGFSTGDLVFNKDNKPLWRMYEDEDGLYLESLLTGKKYEFVLKEISDE